MIKAVRSLPILVFPFKSTISTNSPSYSPLANYTIRPLFYTCLLPPHCAIRIYSMG
uniref:Uncharacterized protein n=1 Tax=Arundo donax TaxID=35708 RepID=A0A0A9HMF3_ARUDO